MQPLAVVDGFDKGADSASLRAGKGDAVVGTDGARQIALGEQPFEGGDGNALARRLDRLAEEQEARRVIGDGQRIAVAAIAETDYGVDIACVDPVLSSSMRFSRMMARSPSRKLNAPDESGRSRRVKMP